LSKTNPVHKKVHQAVIQDLDSLDQSVYQSDDQSISAPTTPLSNRQSPNRAESTNQSFNQSNNDAADQPALQQTNMINGQARLSNQSANHSANQQDDSMPNESNASSQHRSGNKQSIQAQNPNTFTHSAQMPQRARYASMTAEAASKYGVQLMDADRSLVLEVKAENSIGMRWIEALLSIKATNPVMMKTHLSAYLATILRLPFIPLSFLDKPTSETVAEIRAGGRSHDPNILDWVSSTMNLRMVDSTFSFEEYPQADLYPDQSKYRDMIVSQWSQILETSSSILISSRAADAADRQSVKVKLVFPNQLVRSLVINHIMRYQALSNREHVNPNNQTSHTDEQSISQSKPVKRSANTNVSALIQQLYEPIYRTNEEVVAQTATITPHSSLPSNLKLTQSFYSPRFVLIRVDGLPVTAKGHPFIASRNEHPSSDSAALHTLQQVFCWKRDLQSSETVIHPRILTKGSRYTGGSIDIITPAHQRESIKLAHWWWNKSTYAAKNTWQLNSISMQVMERPSMTCTKCHAVGHLANSCNIAVTDIPCIRCSKPDLPEHECLSIDRVVCLLCNNIGHTQLTCGKRKMSWAQILKPKQSLKQSENTLQSVNLNTAAPSCPSGHARADSIDRAEQSEAIASTRNNAISATDQTSSVITSLRCEIVELNKRLESMQSIINALTVNHKPPVAGAELAHAAQPVTLNTSQTDQNLREAITQPTHSQSEHLPNLPAHSSLQAVNGLSVSNTSNQQNQSNQSSLHDANHDDSTDETARFQSIVISLMNTLRPSIELMCKQVITNALQLHSTARLPSNSTTNVPTGTNLA
jgi:hypothetical protein